MRRSLAMLVPILLLGQLEMPAQERLYAGPVIGYEFSVPLLLRRSAGAINFDPSFSGTGSSYSHTAILGGQLVAPSARGILGYSARLSLFASSGSFQSDPFVPGLNLDDTSTAEIPPERFRRIDVEMTAATIVADAQARFSFAPNVIAGAGLWTSYRLSGQFMRIERPEIIPPDVEPDDASTLIGGDRIAAHEWSYGGIVSLGALIDASPSLVLMPELTSRLDAVALRLGMGFQSFTIGAGLSVLLKADDAPVVIVAAPAPADSGPAASDGRGGFTTERPLRLEARVDLFSEESSERTQPAMVTPEEVVNRVIIAMPRVVPYEASAYDLPGGLARISASETHAFGTRALAGLDLAGHWRHYLNILGSRLRESSSSILSLTGVGTADEPRSLARVRAEVLRDYLVDVWGIAPSRISLSTEQGAAPRVRLDGPDALFSAPLLSQWRTRRYRMPQLGLERYVVADAGVRHWTLVIAQGERELARFESDDIASDPAIDVRFIAGGDSAAPIAPIVATLTVEDSLGRTTVARDELAIARASVQAPPGTQRGERLELVAFDEALDSAQAGVELGRAAVRAARMLRDGATVTVGIVGAISDSTRRLRSIDVGRVAEQLLSAANERGVHIGRFVAERDGGGEATPGGIRIVVEQPHEQDATEP